MSQEKIKVALQEFGLTGKEAETYILLAKTGPMKGTEISRQLKRNKGQVYRLLKALQNKGLVESTIESPIRFIAVSFEIALDMFAKAKRDEAKIIEEKTKDLINDWKKISKTRIESSVEKFAVINGTHKTIQKISEMIKDTKSQ
ncbi:MAG: helix-turn-helix domain-containing protein, partial [Clostridiales bacterium]|nr:helix-turn-helix domain-containing protein [Clostridiales bacterium]